MSERPYTGQSLVDTAEAKRAAEASPPVEAEPPAEGPPVSPPAERAPKSRRKWWILAIVVIVAVVIGVLVLRPSSSTPATTTRTQEVQASTTTLQTTVGASGTINPAKRADLAFTSSGTVASVRVAVGDKVKKGQALAAIDLTDLQSSVDAAKSAVDAAQSDYNTAVKSGKSTQITATKSTLKTKQNDLANAKTALADGTLTAPFAGTVAIVDVAVGDKVGNSTGSSSTGNTGSGSNSSQYGNLGSILGNSSTSTTSSTAAITVISTDTYQVTTSVGSADVGSLKKGQDATVVPNGTTTQLPGKVTSVGVIASSSDSSGATFPVTIDITGAQKGLYAGVSAAITIVTASRQALTVPTAAITYQDGQAHVQIKTDSGTADRVVQVGTTSGGRTEITSGLKDGDTVVITITITASTGGGAGGFQSMFGGGGGGRQRPSGAGSGARASGFPTDGGGYPTDGGGFPTDAGGFPTDGQPPQGAPTS